MLQVPKTPFEAGRRKEEPNRRMFEAENKKQKLEYAEEEEALPLEPI